MAGSRPGGRSEPGGILGFLADHREWLGCILAHHSEAVDEAARSSDAWDLVFCQDGDVLLRSHPGGRGGVERFVDVLGNVRTRAMLGHLSSGGATTLRSMGWIYVQDGETEGFEAVRETVRHTLPDFLVRTVRGKGEAEHVFHLILAFLYDSGKLQNPDLPASDLARGVRNALRMMGEIYPRAGLRPPRMTLVVSNCFSAAGYSGGGDLPVRIFTRPVEGPEVHRGVGLRRDSGEVPMFPRTGKRAVLLGSFVEGAREGSVTGTIPGRSLFGITRDCHIEIHEM